MAASSSSPRIIRKPVLRLVLVIAACLVVSLIYWCGQVILSKKPTLVLAHVIESNPITAPRWGWADDHTVYLVRTQASDNKVVVQTSPPDAHVFVPTASAPSPGGGPFGPTYAPDFSWTAWCTIENAKGSVQVARLDGTDLATFIPPPSYQTNYQSGITPFPDGRHLAMVPAVYQEESDILVWDITAPSQPAVHLRHPILHQEASTVPGGVFVRPWILGFHEDGSALAVNSASLDNVRFFPGNGSIHLSWLQPAVNTTDKNQPSRAVHLVRFTPTENGDATAPQTSIVYFPEETTSVSLSLAPDGKHIAWVTDESCSETGPHWARWMAYTVLAQFRFLYSVSPEREWRLRTWVSDADGGNLRELTKLLNKQREYLYPPVWLPNSREFSFIAKKNLYKIAIGDKP